MMRMWRATKLFVLFMIHTAEAAAVSDPVICYILDAFLLIYCIIFTALYFREKFLRSPITQAENKDTQGGEGVGGTHEAVGTRDTDGAAEAAAAPSNPESGVVRRQRTQAADDNYAALQHRTSDTYSHIQNKKKKRAQADKNQVYESLQQPSTDTYNSLEMRPLPPRNPPN